MSLTTDADSTDFVLFDIDILPLTCIWEWWDWRASFYFQLSLPFGAILFCALQFVALMYWFDYRPKRNETKKGVLRWCFDEINEEDSKVQQRFDRHLSYSLLSLDVTHAVGLLKCFQTFVCARASTLVKDSWFLVADPNTKCYDGPHSSLMLVAALHFAFVSFLYPCVSYWFIRTRIIKHHKPASKRIFRIIGYQLDTFKGSHLTWNGLIILRTSMSVAINVSLYKYPFAQGCATIIVLGSYLICLVEARPQIHYRMVNFDITVLLVEAVFLLFGFLFGSPYVGERTRRGFAVTLYVILGLAFVESMRYVIKDVRAESMRLTNVKMLRGRKNSTVGMGERVLRWCFNEINEEDTTSIELDQSLELFVECLKPARFGSYLQDKEIDATSLHAVAKALGEYMKLDHELSAHSPTVKSQFWSSLVAVFPELIDWIVTLKSEGERKKAHEVFNAMEQHVMTTRLDAIALSSESSLRYLAVKRMQSCFPCGKNSPDKTKEESKREMPLYKGVRESFRAPFLFALLEGKVKIDTEGFLRAMAIAHFTRFKQEGEQKTKELRRLSSVNLKYYVEQIVGVNKEEEPQIDIGINKAISDDILHTGDAGDSGLTAEDRDHPDQPAEQNQVWFFGCGRDVSAVL